MKIKITQLFLTALLFSLLFQGCGGSTDSSDTTNTTDTAGATDTSDTTDTTDATDSTDTSGSTNTEELDGNGILPDSISMIAIEGGLFNMGGTTVSNDAPIVTITFSDYALSETEVTNEQYISFLNQANADGWIKVEAQEVSDPCGTYTENMVVGTAIAPHTGQVYLQLGESGGCSSDGKSEHINNKSWISYNSTDDSFDLLDESKADWPVNWVKWYGADAFAQYFAVSLPTEAQWEYAAKAGSLNLEYATDDGSLNSKKANYNGDTPGVVNETGHSFAVKSYTPNPFGLYDMAGNVWEWCSDYYAADFYTDAAVDPSNTAAGADSKRVRRGGSWNYHAATLLTFARASDFEERGNNHFGFRISN